MVNKQDYYDFLVYLEDACLKYYLHTHVSEMRKKSGQEKRFWSLGQELYLLRKEQ